MRAAADILRGGVRRVCTLDPIFYTCCDGKKRGVDGCLRLLVVIFLRVVDRALEMSWDTTPDETTASTTNRNYDRRMGAPSGLLGFPAVASKCNYGRLTDPRMLMDSE